MSGAWPYPLWIAHRGAGRLAPENTLAAFRLGASHGYRAFECDVKLSADGVPFLLHDSTLERTSSGQGTASHLSWGELSIDYRVSNVVGGNTSKVRLSVAHSSANMLRTIVLSHLRERQLYRRRNCVGYQRCWCGFYRSCRQSQCDVERCRRGLRFCVRRLI